MAVSHFLAMGNRPELVMEEGNKVPIPNKAGSTASLRAKPLTANPLLWGNQMNLFIRSLGSNAWVKYLVNM